MMIKLSVISVLISFVALAQGADPALVTSQNVLTGFTSYKEGVSVSFVGDFNGDGLSDYAVGVPENTGGTDSGSVFFVNTGSVDGLSSTVAAQIKLAQLPGISGLTLTRERLGASIATLKPFQGVGTKGVFLVGTSERSRMWMMEVLYSAGSFSVTRAYRVDSLTLTNSTGMNLSNATLGASVALMQKKGREYIVAAGASTHNSRGAVAILGIDTSFSSCRVITYFDSASAPFSGRLDASDFLGISIASLGDLNGDGGIDLAVGAPYDDDDGAENGAVYELFLDSNYAYKKVIKINRKNASGMGSDSVRYFGKSLAGQYDFDHDGVNDLVVGASQTPMSTSVRSGSIQIVSLDTAGTVLRSQLLLPGQYGLAATMVGTSTNYNLAFSLAMDDLDYNGMPNLIVGTTGHNANVGGYWNLQLKVAPWVHNKLDTIEFATNSSVQLWLDTLMIGSGLSYSIGVADSGTTSIVRPSIITANRLLLQSSTIRSVSKIVIKAEDSGSPAGYGPYSVYDTLYVLVSGPNQAPVYSPKDTVRLTEDGPAVAAFWLDTLFHDADDDMLTYEIVSSSSKVTASINSNVLTIAPLADSNGVGTVVVSAKDKIGPAKGTVYFSIASVNDAPVAKDDSTTIDEDVSTTVAVLSNDTDVDGQTLSVGIATQPKLGTASVASGQVVYVPKANANGRDTLHYFVSDGLVNDTAKVIIRIFPLDDAPIIVALDTIMVDEDAGPFTLLDLDTMVLDVDREAFTRGIDNVTPGWASAVLGTDNVLTLTTQKDSNGVVAISVWGKDFGGTETGTLYVKVRDVEEKTESIVNIGSPIQLKANWVGAHTIHVQWDASVSALYVMRSNGSVRNQWHSIRSDEKQVLLPAERGDLLVVQSSGKTWSVRLF